MNTDTAVSLTEIEPDFLRGGGTMAALMRAEDWSKTPLGPLQCWPQSLRSALGICLGSDFPSAIYWGQQLLVLYNDAWGPIAGAEHPAALGGSAHVACGGIWDGIAPQLTRVLTTGRPARLKDQLLPMNGHGQTEERYFDCTFSPIPGENGEAAGVFVTAVETTYRVLEERRRRLLRELAASTAAPSAEETCRRAAAVLGRAPEDVPFCLFYLAAAGGAERLHLAATAGVAPDSRAAPAVIGIDGQPASAWPFAQAAKLGNKVVVNDLVERFDAELPGRPWLERVTSAVVVPLPDTARSGAWAGFMVLGVSPRRPPDGEHEVFVDAAAARIAIAIGLASAPGRDAERRRVESALHFQATVLHQMNEAVVAVDGEQRVTYMNRAAERQYGVVAAEVLGRPLGDVYECRWHSPDEEAAAGAALADTGLSRRENVHVRRDGAVLTVESAVSVLKDEAGRLRGTLAVIRDATERKAMEARLRASEERFRHVSESGLISIAFFSARGEIVDANDAFLDLVGYSREELRNGEVRWDRLTPPEWMPRTREALEEFHATGRISPYEKEYFRRDGSRFWGLFGGARFGETSGGVAFVMDITERKRIEDALRESESRLAAKLAMMKGLHDLSTRLLQSPDLKTVLEEVLAATLAMTAADAGNVRLLRPQSRTLEIATQHGFTQEFLRRFGAVPVEGDSAGARALRSGKRIVVEDVETDPDFAPYRHVAVSAGFRAVQSTPLLSREGKPLGVLSTHFREPRRLAESEEQMLDLYARHAADFIERVRIEEALRESEERLRFALRSANAGVWRLDVATGGNFWSEEFKALYGFDAATPQNYRSWLARVYAEDRERLQAEFRRRRDSDESEFQQEFRIVHPERGVRWILDLGRVERDAQGRALSFSGINLDITERKRAEHALRDSERLYRAIGESINYGVWVCDPEGRNIYASESFLRLVGMTQEECSSFGWSRALHPDDAERTLAAWKECVRTGGQWDIEHRFRGVDGEWHPVLARGMAVRNERGEITAWAGINLDISRQKQVEDELREAHYRKDEFLATLAHELRNPLAPLRNGIAILRLAKDDHDAAEGARAMMERQLQQMVRLIDDLLDLSRISRGKVELRKQRVDLALVLRQAVETSAPLIEQSGHELSISVPAEPLYVDADVTRLAQVFANLLNNAAKYTRRGGRIALAARRRGGEAVARISDNGRGIPAHMLAHVFEMFTQVDRPLENTHGGLGIGLNIVQRLVQMHGGVVEAYSDGPGMGSEFTVRLPLAAPLHEEAPPEDGDPRAYAAGNRRVLIADDNADAAASLAMLLKIMGNDVRTARDGLEAVEVARLFRPELILLDIGMPRLDGYEACRRIRALPWARGALVAALTGWGQEEDKRRSRDAGFDRHMVKPVEPAVLEELLAGLPRETGRVR